MGNINDHNFGMKSSIKAKLFRSTRSLFWYCVLTSYSMPQGDRDRNDQISGQKWP